jgi:hypothetical protein
MIGMCTACNGLGNRYDPKVAPRTEFVCGHCGSELRAPRRDEDATGCVITARRKEQGA